MERDGPKTRLLLLAALVAPLACWCSPAIGQEPELLDDPATLEELDPTLDRTQAPETDKALDDLLRGQFKEDRIMQTTMYTEPLLSREFQPGSLTEEFIRDDEFVKAAFLQMLVDRFERETQILQERRDVIRWTNWISRFIFVVIHIVLAIGLWAAMREFIDAGRTRKRTITPAGQQAAPTAQEQNEFRISLEGIALKTSLHGLLILAAALGFYFLYLKFVYPITVIGD